MTKVFKFLLISAISVIGIIAVAIAFLVLADDSEIVSCPALNKKLISWFPYSKNSELRFINKDSQLSEKITFNSLRVQHRSAYNAGVKCGTCGDLVEAIFAFGRDTLSVSVESGEAMFANTSITNLNGLYPMGIKEGPTTMLLSWSDSANPSGITQALFSKKQGLVWYERNKQKFYRVRIDSTSGYDVGQVAINDIAGCQ